MTADDADHPANLLSPYLDGVLSGEERARVERHLEDCAACRGELAALRALAAAVSGEAPPPVPDGLAGRIAAAAAASHAVPVRRRFAVPVSIAATVAAVGLLVAYRWHEGAPPVPSAPAVAEAGPEAIPAAPSAAQGETGASRGRIAAPKAERKKVSATVPPPPDVPREDAARLGAAGIPDHAESDESRNAPAAAMAPPPAAAGAARVSTQRSADDALPCTGPSQDAGTVATWEVGDMQIALRELAAIAAEAGGRGDGAPVQSGRPYEIYVPRDRFAGLLGTLGARGVTNLPHEAPAASAARCLRLRVSIRVVLGAP